MKWGEQRLAKHAFELPWTIGPAMADRCPVEAGPYASAVRRYDQEAAVSREHAPSFSHHAAQLLAVFGRMDHQQSIDREIGEGKFGFVGKCHEPRLAAWPCHHALRRRRQGRDACRFVEEGPQIGRRVTDAQYRHAPDIRPEFADALADQPSRHLAETGSVELVQIDNVTPHMYSLVQGAA